MVGQEQHMVHGVCRRARVCVCVELHLRAVYTHKSNGIRLTAADAPAGIYLSQTIQLLLKVPD